MVPIAEDMHSLQGLGPIDRRGAAAPRDTHPGPRSPDRLGRRIANRDPTGHETAGAREFGVFQAKAFSLVTSSKVQEAFDLSREPAKVRDRYGRHSWGQSHLLARRLVEAGVPFVTVDDDGWDHHAKVFPGLRQRLPKLDRCLSALPSSSLMKACCRISDFRLLRTWRQAEKVSWDPCLRKKPALAVLGCRGS